MNEILANLGKRESSLEKVYLFLQMFLVVCFFLILIDVIYNLFNFNILIIHVFFWVVWFLWQGFFFERNRSWYLKKFSKNPYKAAYYRDILFGVAFGISQMIRPFYHGVLHNDIQISALNWIFFSLLIVIGIGLMVAGFSVIGFAAAGFLYEFKLNTEKKTCILERGIYKVIRHPLFFGGTLASLGCSLIFTPQIWYIGIINICILPIYIAIEDHRQAKIFGHPYLNYCSKVGSIVPKLTTVTYLCLHLFMDVKNVPKQNSEPEIDEKI